MCAFIFIYATPSHKQYADHDMSLNLRLSQYDEQTHESTESEINMKRCATLTAYTMINSKRVGFFSRLIYSPARSHFSGVHALITI